ncbi:MAG: T9SS type A sorting domain-containing protein, partial [Vicingaceae bacterium]|nr:T9SS type A sorting domain-containing protein [Vicingaceae bacterium]
ISYGFFIVSYNIIDLTGKVVKNGVLQKAQSKINLENLNSGFYLFSITQNNGEVFTKKFLKQ